MMMTRRLALFGILGCHLSEAFVPPRLPTMPQTTTTTTSTTTTTTSLGTATSKVGMFFASSETKKPVKTNENSSPVMTRELGSQELLMLPRQYGPSEVEFPQMNHVSAIKLSSTPSLENLKLAMERIVAVHPLLRCQVQGDGEPDRRIDLFQMVRQGEPAPCTFVTQHVHMNDAVQLVPTDDCETSWKSTFGKDLDDGSWCQPNKGLLWKLELHAKSAAAAEQEPCYLVFSFNHAISDQSSVNRLLDQLLEQLQAIDEGNPNPPAYKSNDMPVSLEDSVLGLQKAWKHVGPGGLSLQTAAYVAGKAGEGLRDPVILPEKGNDSSNNPLGALSIISGQTAGGKDEEARRSSLEFRKVSKETTAALLQACRQKGVSISNALTAAVTLTATDHIGQDQARNYKVLQSLDMRRFGAQLDKGESVACMAGSHDLMHGPLPDQSGKALRQNPTPARLERFWNLAKEGKAQTEAFVASGGPEQAVRVFDFAMTIADLNNLVHLTAQSKDTKGRAYSAGVTNVGVYEMQQGFPRADGTRENLKLQRGKYRVEDIYFATPHTTSGCLFQVSGLTLDGEMRLTFNPVYPIVNDETNKEFADSFVEILEVVAGTKQVPVTEEGEDSALVSFAKENALPAMALVIGAAAVASHASAWSDFFASVMEMKANTTPEEFWPALNFWIFFAVGHPILQPILWISDVLHGTPGPMVGGLVPALFLAGNAAVIAAVTMSKQVRNAVNIAAVAAFFAYVGAGLDGTAGLGDFNLALDDSYKGQVVKGCPAYNEVRQSSMDDFDLKKYQGLWYEHKFHDWTQFKEVYDTSLGIKLTEGGNGWIDDFAVKGPAPDSAPLSWDKSPVGNGAHYFLFGRVDQNDPPGILREKGFGVEFPNYIVGA